jgi:hypothetical protein
MSNDKIETNPGKWKPNEAQKEVLMGLLQESDKEKTIVDFAKKFLPFGRSKFDQIMDVFDAARPQSYFDKVSDEVKVELIEELATILERIPMKRLQLARVTEIKIHKTSKIEALEAAINEASSKDGPERLIIQLGPTGAGKTITSNYLASAVSARFVEVRDVWRRSESGIVPLTDICRALDVRVAKYRNRVADMQDGLIKFCEERRVVLCFDEGEHFGKSALNLLKLLLNKTKLVPVIHVVPGEYEKWFTYFPNEADQIARRTHAIVDCSIIDPVDAALFFPADQFEKRTEALEVICREANSFGHYSLINRVAGELRGIVKAKLGEAGDVATALARAKRQMKTPPRSNK